MSGPIRILLLEDDPADARLVGQMLRRIKTMPFEVVVASRLAEAVARLRAGIEVFDVVLADLGLPDSTGIGTLDALTEAAPRLPVVVLTGNDDDAVALEALKRGAQDYLVKGIGDAFILSRVVRYAIERKLGEEALREARDTAEQAARAKTLFLAMMGHEIRTPLNGVLGMARLLMESDLDGRQRVYAETLVSSGELLLGLVNDILDFSRLDASGLTLEAESFDLLDTVEEVRLILASRADEKGVALTSRYAWNLRRHMVGDRLRLRQILFNLVGNAIKFTDSGSVVISMEPLGDDMVRIAVIDTGIGISDEARPHLFTEFWQGDSGTARRFAGAGLGLAICARLVALMGGAIGCVSDVGRGSTFTVDLPLIGDGGGAVGGEEPQEQPCRPRRILLVDDNQVNREVAAGLLERRGHSVVPVHDGFKAVEEARSGGFDLVLLDMRMPGMDGIETARAISALPGDAGKVPLLLLTANPIKEDEARWREVGIRGCLAKPFRVDDLGRLLTGLEPGGEATAKPESEPVLLSLSDLLADLRDLGQERMIGLVRLYQRSSLEDFALVRGHDRDGRLEDLAKIAHRMAGAASSLHLVALTACCRSLEDAARRSDGTSCRAALDGLERLWRRSMTALTAEMELDG